MTRFPTLSVASLFPIALALVVCHGLILGCGRGSSVAAIVADRSAISTCGSRSEPRLLGFATLILGHDKALGVARGQAPAAPEGPAPAAQAAERRAAWIEFEGPIHPLSEHAFYRKLDKALAAGATLIFVEITSPGGLVDSSFALADRLAHSGDDGDAERDVAHVEARADQAPPHRVTTVAFIPREALSGAAIMALGCHQIVISPTARLGDAGPIFQDEKGDFRHAPEKIRTDLVRRIRDLAERSGRPPALAEAMMDTEVEVFRVTHTPTNKTSYLSQAELEALPDPQNWVKGPLVPESRKGLFLEVNGERAVEIGLANATAATQEQVLQSFEVDRRQLMEFRSDWVDLFAIILNSWPVTVLLLIIALTGLYVEFSAPGISVGGLLAVICFALYFWSRFLGGTSGWLEVVMFLVGMVFLLLEFLVIPGFGIAGLLGFAFVILSLIMAGQQFVIPHNQAELQTLFSSVAVVAAAGTGFAMVAWLISRYLGTIPVLGRLALQPPQPEPTVGTMDFAGHSPIGELAVGQVGQSDSALRPAGRGQFGNNFYDVVSDGSYVDRGRPIRILEISGNRVVVREVS